MAKLDEIIVRAKRPKGNIPMGPGTGPRGAGPGGGPGFASKRIRDTLTKLQAGVDVAKKAGKPIEEIIVRAKPAAKFGRFLGPWGAGALFLGDIGAKIADEISQRKLDAAGRKATRTVPPRPDTPVETIQPEEIEEIIVRGKMPRPSRPALPPAFLADPWGFTDPIGKMPIGARGSQPKTPTISTPKPPAKPTKTVVPSDPLTRIPFDLPGSEPRIVRMPEPNPIPRSRLLGIGSGLPKSIPGISTGVPGANVTALPMPATQTRATICGPCPRAKRKKKQRREKCYRQLVKQGRYASRDKTSKWAQIDCDTGKTIKELI